MSTKLSVIFSKFRTFWDENPGSRDWVCYAINNAAAGWSGHKNITPAITGPQADRATSHIRTLLGGFSTLGSWLSVKHPDDLHRWNSMHPNDARLIQYRRMWLDHIISTLEAQGR